MLCKPCKPFFFFTEPRFKNSVWTVLSILCRESESFLSAVFQTHLWFGWCCEDDGYPPWFTIAEAGLCLPTVAIGSATGSRVHLINFWYAEDLGRLPVHRACGRATGWTRAPQTFVVWGPYKLSFSFIFWETCSPRQNVQEPHSELWVRRWYLFHRRFDLLWGVWCQEWEAANWCCRRWAGGSCAGEVGAVSAEEWINGNWPVEQIWTSGQGWCCYLAGFGGCIQRLSLQDWCPSLKVFVPRSPS